MSDAGEHEGKAASGSSWALAPWERIVIVAGVLVAALALFMLFGGASQFLPTDSFGGY